MTEKEQLYCPRCLISNIPDFDPKLTTEMTLLNYPPFDFKCSKCGYLYKDESELLTKKECLVKLYGMVHKLYYTIGRV